MEAVNCLRCEYKDADNGNCTAAGGFCTAVPAAYCPLLRRYLGTGMTPEQAANAKTIIESAFAEDTSKAERIRKLLAADKEGRVLILPCKRGDGIYICSAGRAWRFWVFLLPPLREGRPQLYPGANILVAFLLTPLREGRRGEYSLQATYVSQFLLTPLREGQRCALVFQLQ